VAVRLRYLGTIVVVGTLWHPGLIAKGVADDCAQTSDCQNRVQGSVCVAGSCVSCTEDASQCNNYEDLDQPFCDYDSGMCWENSDCNDWGQSVGNSCEESCSACTDGCADSCYAGLTCDDWDLGGQYGECVFEF
jgi:hypothetical protein